MRPIKILFFLLALSGCAAKPKILQIKEQKLNIQGKEASIYTVVQPDGTVGLTFKKGETFDVLVENQLDVPTSIHWHGLILPDNQDGVAFITQFPIYPSQIYPYRFPLVQTGTYWMHAHYGLQEQKLYTAPLIIQDTDEKQIVLLLNDFTWTSAEKILEDLRCKMAMHSTQLTDVDYDAFLINFRSIEDPEKILVFPGETVRLRIINGASSTNFFLDLGRLEGEAIAVDGNPIHPVKKRQFELAVAQRIDIRITLPQSGGAFPILARGEGTRMQGGTILYTAGAPTPTLSSEISSQTGALAYAQEKEFRTLSPLPFKIPDQKIDLVLGGTMTGFIWTINGQAWPEITPLQVQKGQRVEIIFKNESPMSHPMHLHGHIFQVTAIDGIPFQGALRDTVLVLPHSTLSIQFNADNPGVWPLHCHLLYHQEAGMFTVLRYE